MQWDNDAAAVFEPDIGAGIEHALVDAPRVGEEIGDLTAGASQLPRRDGDPRTWHNGTIKWHGYRWCAEGLRQQHFGADIAPWVCRAGEQHCVVDALGEGLVELGLHR